MRIPQEPEPGGCHRFVGVLRPELLLQARQHLQRASREGRQVYDRIRRLRRHWWKLSHQHRSLNDVFCHHEIHADGWLDPPKLLLRFRMTLAKLLLGSHRWLVLEH